jgi:regulator of RNase E activity RraA
MFGKHEYGTFMGDNLAYYIMKKTGTGLVIDGSVRDLEGIATYKMPVYYRHSHPTPIRDVMLTGFNVPINIGGITVMPGDVLLGDREGISIIPPQLVDDVIKKGEDTRIHDVWTKKKFDEGKYKSSDIYGSPRDPALKAEYEEYRKKELSKIK